VNVAAETLAAYERWAPLYPPIAHNPLMRAEQRLMRRYWPEVAGRRTLDLACGSGRYSQLFAEAGAAQVLSLDVCVAMLRQVPVGTRICASMMHLPFAPGTFDVVVSGLAVGHAPAIHPWMAEAASVLRKGGTLLYSDFHPDAARAGLTRSFKDGNGLTCCVPHRQFSVASQLDAAKAAGLQVEAMHEVRVGMELRESFPGSEDFYRRWHGLPIILIVRACK
jgi:malonyl-CoA O-methyltransferase